MRQHLRLGLRPSLERLHLDLVFAGHSRKAVSGRRVFDSRRRAQAVQQTRHQLAAGIPIGRFAPGSADVKSEDVLRLEARRHAAEFLKAAHQQPGARQQSYRERHLHAHQNELYRVAPRYLRTARMRERAGEVSPRSPYGRIESADECRPNRAGQRIKDDSEVQADLVDARQILGKGPKHSGRAGRQE